MKKKKIAVLCLKGLPAFGGAARAGESVIERLKDKYNFTVYALDSHTKIHGDYNGLNQIVFRSFPGKRLNTFLYYAQSVCHALFVGKYDIVHINHTSSGFIAPFLSLKYKIVATARGIIPKNDNKWNKIDKFLFNLSAFLFFRFSNQIITVSKPHINIFSKLTSKKIYYIPNGVNIDEHPYADSNKDDYLLFAASRIIFLKGLHVFLESLNKLKYESQVVIIGNLDHTPNYKKHLLKISRDRNLIFTGLIKGKNQLFLYIRKAKLFVFPSFNEGMSNMLLEVASLKTPIICSDIQENVAVFSDNEVLFFKTGDSIDLACKIKWALAHPVEMKGKADRAYEKLIRYYNWTDIAKKYEKIYESF